MIKVSDLIEWTVAELKQLRENTEGESTGSSGSSSSNSSSSWGLGGGEEREEDVVVKEGEEVNQVKDPYQVPTIALSALVPTVEPILVPI